MSQTANLHILQHSLGLNSRGEGNAYRNHFVTGPGSKDYEDCRHLVSLGLMEQRPGNPLTGGDDLFTVTQAGRVFVAQESKRRLSVTP